MARERMVTRTVEVNTFEVMTVNVETADVQIREFKLYGEYDKKKDSLTLLKKQYETETLKLVNITNHSVKTVLYGMPERMFIELSEVLPPRGANNEE